MIGAIAGDIIGSPYEYSDNRTKDFPLFTERTDFTDDSVMSIAIAASILDDTDYGVNLRRFARAYPDRGYGGMFASWIASDDMGPYGSFGNGAAMRVGPVGFAFDSIERVLDEARRTAECSHNHPEGIKGAQATAMAIFLARNGSSKEDIRAEVTRFSGYDLSRSIDELRCTHWYNETCQECVPEAIIAFLDSSSYEETIRNAISIGGDADTLACISGGIAEAFYRVIPDAILQPCLDRLAPELRDIVDRFEKRFGVLAYPSH